MKKVFAVALSFSLAFVLAGCGNSGNSGSSGSASSAAPSSSETSAPQETISLTVWGAEGDQTLLNDLVSQFEAAHPDQTFDIRVGVESESSAKDTVLTDIQAAADVFAFANDQINDLIAAGALLPLDSNIDAVLQAYAGKSLQDVKDANNAGSVAAVTYNGTMYAFPSVGGNNYFLFYDSTRVTPEQAQSWDGLLEAANACGSKVGMTLASGWYNASFFLGAGFTVDLNDDGTTALSWNGTSPDGYTGVDVANAMLTIARNPGFLAIADGDISNQIAAGNVCAVISGTWDANAAQAAFGDGYSATKLPTYTINGNQVQMGCYSGYKLIGVNRYTDQAGWAALLAEFLTNEDSQMARFENGQQAPTNLVAASSEAVRNNAAIAASSAQDAFGVVQRVSGRYWSPTATFGEMVAQGTLNVGDTAAIQVALDNLVEGATSPLE